MYSSTSYNAAATGGYRRQPGGATGLSASIGRTTHNVPNRASFNNSGGGSSVGGVAYGKDSGLKSTTLSYAARNGVMCASASFKNTGGSKFV